MAQYLQNQISVQWNKDSTVNKSVEFEVQEAVVSLDETNTEMLTPVLVMTENDGILSLSTSVVFFGDQPQGVLALTYDGRQFQTIFNGLVYTKVSDWTSALVLTFSYFKSSDGTGILIVGDIAIEP